MYGAWLVVREDKGDILVVAFRIFAGSVSIEIAEARAILEGLHPAADRNFFPFYIESDALNVINLSKSVSFSFGEVDNLIFDIRSLLGRFSGQVSFLLVPRLCNGVAHEITKRAVHFDLFVIWDINIPLWLLVLAYVDVNSASFP
ncbi:hypothetical protein ACOSQ4_009541 [Xanthoceras sorbifolium]